MAVPHDPTVLPTDLPVPPDDGGARHLNGLKLPALALTATDAENGVFSPTLPATKSGRPS